MKLIYKKVKVYWLKNILAMFTIAICQLFKKFHMIMFLQFKSKFLSLRLFEGHDVGRLLYSYWHQLRHKIKNT